MTILGRGDLSPRRRRSRWPRALLVLVVLAALGVGGWFGWQAWGGGGTTTLRPAATPCPTASASPSAPPAVTAPVRVLNGSLRPGLAATAARLLHRSFHVTVARIGNAVSFLRGDSEIRYPAPLAGQAQRLAAMVVPAPRLVAVASGSKLELDLGTRFRRVATVTEFRGALPASGTPSATPTPARPSPTGRPCLTS